MADHEVLYNVEKSMAEVEVDDDGRPKRTGTMWTVSAHIITAVVGSGILSLAWALAQLGWIAGVGILLIFSSITFYTSTILADCYRYPNTSSGKRNYTYMDAVKSYLGGAKYKACGFAQYINLSGLAVGYTITSSLSMVTTYKAICYHRRGHHEESSSSSSSSSTCEISSGPLMIGIGIFEIFLSQIPNFHKMEWLSIVASFTSFGYSFIGMGLSLARIISGKGGKSSLTGVEIGPNLSAIDKTWVMFTAIGDMAFACSYSLVLIEVQDTLKPTPPENVVMKKGSAIGISVSTILYVLCSCFGYAAFGNNAPGNLLAGFGLYESYWLVALANIFIVVHLLLGYQLLVQPVFGLVESWAIFNYPNSKFVTANYPILKIANINLLRLAWRTTVVMGVTLIAMAFPFFNAILGLLGAIGYWPTTVYFPLQMCIAQKKIKRGTIKWLALQVLTWVCLAVAIAAGVGSIQGLRKDVNKGDKPFQF